MLQTELIVVDNDSGDASEQIILSEFPFVRWIQMGYNSGFARANNAGIRSAEGDIILLLNPDTIDNTNAVETCFQLFRQTNYIACGVQLLNADGTPQISGNYFMTGGLNHLMALPYLGRLIRAVGLGLRVKKTNLPQAQGRVEVDWINGAFLMVKKTAIESAGLLDEDFFLYSEEIEWCSRLRKTGRMYVDGDLHVIHLEGSSANKEFGSEGRGYHRLNDRKGLQIMLSALVRIRKQFGVGWFLFHYLFFLATVIIYFIIALFKTIFFIPARRSEWRNWAGFTKNVALVSKLFFVILGNRRHFYKVL
jgi:GT2 family glycosyltransferase